MTKLKIGFDIDDTIYKIDVDKAGHMLQTPDYKLINVLLWFHENGHEIYAWSAGGNDYAKSIITKLGLDRIMHVISKEAGTDMDISFDDMEVSLAKVNVQVKRPGVDECRVCGKKLIPDTEGKLYGKDVWDGHTYKPDCEHYPVGVRISIG
jgi:hypothetical protein